jgi:hypothetical protein
MVEKDYGVSLRKSVGDGRIPMSPERKIVLFSSLSSRTILLNASSISFV